MGLCHQIRIAKSAVIGWALVKNPGARLLKNSVVPFTQHFEPHVSSYRHFVPCENLYCDIPTKKPRIVCPPQKVDGFSPANFSTTATMLPSNNLSTLDFMQFNRSESFCEYKDYPG